jgi:hypothetical protein
MDSQTLLPVLVLVFAATLVRCGGSPSTGRTDDGGSDESSRLESGQDDAMRDLPNDAGGEAAMDVERAIDAYAAAEAGADTGGADAAAGNGKADAADAPNNGCTTPPADATDIYVDKQSAAACETGSIDCPFRAIGAALALAVPSGVARAVHVKGGTPIVEYLEGGLRMTAPNMTLAGDGPDRTRIRAPAACAAGCDLLEVDATSTIVGLELLGNDANQAGLHTRGGPVVVHHVRESHAFYHGLWDDLGGIELRDVSFDHNGYHGVSSFGDLHVVAPLAGESNTFDANAHDGVNAGHLIFEGGQANDNGGSGVKVDTLVAVTVNGLSARGNGRAGLYAFQGTVSVRGCTLVGNAIGLLVSPNSASLDAGTAASPGGNVFGGAMGRNTNAAMCVDETAYLPIAANGNAWSACPPAQIDSSDCFALTSYVDVAYVATGGIKDPVRAGGCTVGP